MTKNVRLTDREIDEFLKALANENRRKILFLFFDGRERSVGEIATTAKLGQSTVSEHLAILRRASVLVSRKEGKEVFYKPDRVAIARILQKFSELLMNCC